MSIIIENNNIIIEGKEVLKPANDWIQEMENQLVIDGFILALTTVGFECITPEEDESGTLTYCN